MTYSYTQLAQYLACPLRYRYRYLDGWQEKETRAGLLFGRAFEQALAALFRREDPGCALFDAWAQYKNASLEYPKSETWDQMFEQGIHLLERFAQDDRVRIRNPRRNLQIKFSRPIGSTNEFVAYVDAIGQLNGERSVQFTRVGKNPFFAAQRLASEHLLVLACGRLRSIPARNHCLWRHSRIRDGAS